MNSIVLCKTNINEISKELNNAVLMYDYLCLSKTHKWCNEMLYSLDNVTLSDDTLTINYNKIFGKEYRTYQLARSYFNLKEYQRAIFYLQPKSSESPLCYYLLAYSKYMAILKKCVDNKSDLFTNPDATTLESLQSLRNELKMRYSKSQMDACTLYVYGIVLSKLKLTDEAVHILLEAVNKQPTLWCAWLELANLIKTIDSLNNLNHSALPQHWLKDLFLAHCYMDLSLNDEALSIYLEYCNRGFSKSIYIKSQIAKCYDNLREGQECKQTFELIRKLDPYNLDYMDIYSNILFVLEEHAQLAVLAQEACEIDKYRPESCCIIGNYYSLQNDHHKAVTYFQRALKLNPAYVQAWTLMGHEFMELKNSSAAIQSYTHAIEFNPKDYRAWYGIGQTYEILKLYSYSLYYYKQVYLMRPNDSRFIVALGDVYVKLEKWDEARRCYIKAYSVGDCEGTALCKLAKVYEKLGDPMNAAVAYDKYTQDQKLMQGSANTADLSQAYRFLANFYLKKGKLDNAYEAATKCLEFQETRLEAQSLLNQISQTRNLKEQEAAANTDMDIGSANGNNNTTSSTATLNNNKTNAMSNNNVTGGGNNTNANSNHTNTILLENDLQQSSDNSNNSITMKSLNKSTKGAATSVPGATASTAATTGGSMAAATDSECDSDADTMYNDFHIKRFSLRKDM